MCHESNGDSVCTVNVYKIYSTSNCEKNSNKCFINKKVINSSNYFSRFSLVSKNESRD